MARLKPSVPPMLLERRFLILAVDDGAPLEQTLTNGQALAQIEQRMTAPWVVVLRHPQEQKPTRFYAVQREVFLKVLRNRTAAHPLEITLNSQFKQAQVLTLAEYQSSAAFPAVVVLDDHTVVGVTEARLEADRAAVEVVFERAPAATRGGDLWQKAELFPMPAAGKYAGIDIHDTPPIDADTPHPQRLDAFMPDTVRLQETVSLVVTLERIAVALATAGDVWMRDGEKLDVTVRPGTGLELLQGNTLPLVAQAHNAAPAVEFKLRGTQAGATSVKVYAFSQHRSVALMTLYVNVVDASGKAEDAPPQSQEATAPLPDAPATHRSDLCLLVFEDANKLHFKLQSKAYGAQDFQSTIASNSREYFRQFAALVEGLPIRDPERRVDSRRRLEAWGAGLFEQLIPLALQAILWQNQGDITVQICSDEAWIPWEACRLMRLREDGHIEEGPFFAEAFVMTRWLHGTAAPESFRFTQCALVVPSSSGLSTAAKERDFYLGLARNGRAVTEVAPRYLKLTQALEAGTFDAWHFCGHANAGPPGQGDRATLRLDGNDTMSADLFAGTVENALLTRPFIFFNACQSAVGDQALTGVGGWAHRFIRPNEEHRGASVFIGTYWSVYDTSAHQFATTLYRLMDEGLPIGAAVRQARLAAQRADEPGTVSDPLSWLAYTVYADPLAMLETSK